VPPTAPRDPLRRDAIVDEARALISSDGLDALTLRRLGDRFSSVQWRSGSSTN